MKRLLRRVLAARSGSRTVRNSAQGSTDVNDKDWKAKATEAISRAKQFEEQARHEAKRAEKFKVAAERLEKRTAAFDELASRLKEVERELAVAREHLMAIEVKLDILEGAANVLDVRTRTAIQQQAETGARV